MLLRVLQKFFRPSKALLRLSAAFFVNIGSAYFLTLFVTDNVLVLLQTSVSVSILLFIAYGAEQLLSSYPS